MVFLCMCTVYVHIYIYIYIYMIIECIPYVMYRLWGNKFTETGKTRLHQAEQERKKQTGFERFSLGI